MVLREWYRRMADTAKVKRKRNRFLKVVNYVKCIHSNRCGGRNHCSAYCILFDRRNNCLACMAKCNVGFPRSRQGRIPCSEDRMVEHCMLVIRLRYTNQGLSNKQQQVRSTSWKISRINLNTQAFSSLLPLRLRQKWKTALPVDSLQ